VNVMSEPVPVLVRVDAFEVNPLLLDPPACPEDVTSGYTRWNTVGTSFVPLNGDGQHQKTRVRSPEGRHPCTAT